MRKAKTFLILGALGLFGLGFPTTAQARPRQKSSEQNKTQPRQVSKAGMENNKGNEAPFMCKIGALDATERARYLALGKRLRESIEEVKELPNGYAFRLPAETSTILSVAEWVAFERLCCPFFAFAIEMEGEGKPLWLRMTGREGVKQFMRAELGIQKPEK